MHKTFILFLLSIGISITSVAQKVPSSATKFEALVKQTIAKAYPASVLMWEIDASTGNRMSAQFSGVVVTKDGFILSAAHVVRNDHSYQVMFADGKVAVAKGLGRIAFPPNFMVPDAAMLKLTGDGPWPFAEMGRSDGLLVGQPCISIAYPESVEQHKPNIRLGEVKVLKNEFGFIESSCIMEPGDSGGPLFDLDGKVIGIHSGIRASEQINYEVPVDTYRRYWNWLTKADNYTAMPKDSIQLAAVPSGIERPGMSLKTEMLKKFGKVDLDTRGISLTISSTVDGKQQKIIGTMLSQDGLTRKQDPAQNLVVSKSSMVGADPELSFNDNGNEFQHKRFTLQVIARDRVNDLVLLKVAFLQNKSVSLKKDLADSIAFTQLGNVLLSQFVDIAAIWGVTGSQYITLPPKSSYGYIGAATGLKDDHLVFTTVQPGSAAAGAGITVGERVESVDNKRPEDELDFVKSLSGHLAGDTVTIITSSKGTDLKTCKVILKYPPQRLGNHPAEHFAGGKSIRRDGFKNVFIQDASLKPEQCGSPVFDLKGNFIGINIARLSRTSTVVIPAATVRGFVVEALEGSEVAKP